jgi:hypothetical protein
MKYLFLTVAFSSLLLFNSCKTVKVQQPVETYSSLPVPSKPSIVTFTTESKISDIQSELNKNLTGLLYEDNSLENNNDDNVMAKAWKQGEIEVTMEGNNISYTVPLKTWIKSGFNVTKFGLSISDYRELNGALALKFNTNVTLNPDWTVTTKTTSDGYQWLTTPTVKVGGMDISVKFVADVILQSSLKKVGSIIDKSIKDYLNLKPYAEEAWGMMNKPVKLNDEYNVWLQLDPQKLVSSSLSASKGIIRHQAGMTGIVKLSVGTQPASSNTPKPLPNLLIGKIPTEDTKIYAYISMPYAEINKTAVQYLKGKSFEQGRRKVVIDDVKIYGSEGSMIAETKLSGSLNGTIYFKGKPAYNSADSTLVINDFDYDLSTKNFLMKSASWLYQEGFKRMIASQLKWSIKKELTLVRSSINDNLKAYKISDGIVLKGKVDKVEPGTVYLTTEGIIPEIIASGKLGITIEKLGL